MSSPMGGVTSSATNASSAVTKAAAKTDLANKDMFLQLLVAQIKHQDPLNPTDGTQYVAQLAQFSQLEQSIAMRQDLDKLTGSTTATTTSTDQKGN